MKKSIQIMAVFLSATMLFGGCGKKDGSSKKKSSNKNETSEKNESGKIQADMEKKYPETRLPATPLETEIKNVPDAACEISEVTISEVVQDDFEHVEIHEGPYYAGKDLKVKLNLSSSTGKSEFTAYLFPSGANYKYDLEEALVSPVDFIAVENSKSALSAIKQRLYPLPLARVEKVTIYPLLSLKERILLFSFSSERVFIYPPVFSRPKSLTAIPSYFCSEYTVSGLKSLPYGYIIAPRLYTRTSQLVPFTACLPFIYT